MEFVLGNFLIFCHIELPFLIYFYIFYQIPLDTRRKLNAHKTFRRGPGRILNVLCTFNVRLVSKG